MNISLRNFSISIFFTIALSGHLHAQPYFDVLNVHYINSSSSYSGNGSYQSSAIQYITFQAGFPVINKKNILLVQPFYENYRLKFTIEKNNLQSFSGLGLPVTYLKQWKSEKWKTAFVFIPRINSDFKNIRSNHYQAGGVLLAIYKRTETLKYQFGLYYNSEFFGPFFIPLLGIDWNLNSRMNLFGVLPGNLTLEYKINSIFYGGINFKSITNSYRFNSSANSGDFLKISDNYLKLFLDYYPVKTIAISIEAGHSIFRKYSAGNGDVLIKQEQFKDGILFKAGLAYRIRLADKK